MEESHSDNNGQTANSGLAGHAFSGGLSFLGLMVATFSVLLSHYDSVRDLRDEAQLFLYLIYVVTLMVILSGGIVLASLFTLVGRPVRRVYIIFPVVTITTAVMVFVPIWMVLVIG